MLGDIFGRRAGDNTAEEVLCRFLFDLAPRGSGFMDLFESASRFSCDFKAAIRGVLVALNLALLADKVGVLSLSSLALPVSIFGRVHFC